MKIYLTMLPIGLSKEGVVEKYNYEAVADCKINNNIVTGFPVLKIMEDTLDVEDDGDYEDYSIIAIQTKTEDSTSVYEEFFLKELEENGYDKEKVKLIELEDNQNQKTMNKMMLSIIKSILDIKEEKEVYASIEYGTKIMSITNIYALQIVQRIDKNVTIEGLYYGEIKWNKGKAIGAYFHDVSSMFYLNQLLTELDLEGIVDPYLFIERMLYPFDNQ